MTEKFNLVETKIQDTFLIEASAGTGKTYSLTRIVLRLLMETKITIDQVLMVTYTNSAAAELRARLRDLLLELRRGIQSADGDFDNVQFKNDEVLNELFHRWDKTDIEKKVQAALDGLDDCCISTIHSFCQKMLREYSFSGSRSGSYELADNVDDILNRAIDDFVRSELQNASESLKKEILAEDPIEVLGEILEAYFDAPQNPHLEFYARWKKAAIETEIKNQEGKKRKKKISTAEDLGLDSEEMEAFLKRFLETVPAQVEQLKIAQGVCTYSDLISGVEKELDDTDFKKNIRNKFQAVLIDEFQDTDPIQYQIFSTLFLDDPEEGDNHSIKADKNRSLIFVGDPKQSIYRFRGADIATYNKARSQVNNVYSLAANYRSSPALLESINEYFADDEESNNSAFCTQAIQYSSVEAKAKKAPLYREVDGKKQLIPVFELWYRENTDESLYSDEQREQEAQLVANDIVNLLNSGVMREDNQPLSAKDIVILVRKHKDADYVIHELAKNNIRCLAFAREDVFDTDEAEDILKLLSAMEVPQDSKRLKLARLTRIMGEKVNDVSPEAFEGNQDEDLSIVERKALLARETIDQATKLFEQKGVASAFAYIFEKCNTRSNLLPIAGGEKSLNNYQHIIELLQEQSRHLTTLSGLTRWFIKARETNGGERRETRIENDEDLVTIMTIHKSKGLEYPVVYLVGAWSNKKNNPYPPKHICFDVSENGQNRLTISYSQQPVTDINKGDNQGIAFNDEIETIRLAYVAMTRASQRLVLPLMLTQKANANQFKGPYYSALTKEMVPSKDSIQKAREKLFDGIKVRIEKLNNNTQAVSTEDLVVAYDIPKDAERLDHHTSETKTKSVEKELTIAPSHNIYSDWQQSSYSAIVRGANEQFDLTNQAEKEDQGEDDEEPKKIVSTEGLTDYDRAIFNFSRGAESGTFLHAIFERIDFKLVRRALENDTEADEKLLSRADVIALPYKHNFENLNPNMLCDLMKNVLCCSIFKNPDGSNFQLCNIENSQREMTFTMAINASMKGRKAVTVESLSLLLKDFEKKYHLPNLKPKILKGFLTGAIDMVFEHNGQYFVLDWKSNHLGYHVADYQMPAMEKAMAEHHYYLQYLIYCVALKRFLKSRGIELTSDNFGGVIYAFIRGMRINNDEPYGIYFEKPSLALIECLDDFFTNGFDEQTIGKFGELAREGL